jgi:geranylgeranylglycerol-phosphate geranylgeranyltransferase
MVINKEVSLTTHLIAHIETWRPYTVIWCGLLSLSGAVLTFQGLPSLQISLFSLFTPIFGWIAGLYLADYVDRSLDKIQKKHRPIPSGRMKPIEALITGGIFVLVGTILTVWIRYENLMFIPLSGILVFMYAKYTKSKGFLGNINRGLLALSTFYFGVFAISFQLEKIPDYIWFFSLIFLFHDMNTNIVGTLRDMDGDKKAGYQTIPVRYGIKKAIIFSSFLTIFWFCLTLFLSVLFVKSAPFYYVMLIIDGIILCLIINKSKQVYQSYSRMKSLDMHKLFVLERITLASAFLFIFIHVQYAVIMYISCLLFTALFQQILRNQYEFNKWTL